jgi:hypothetical protein
MFTKVEISDHLNERLAKVVEPIVENIEKKSLIEISGNRAVILCEKDILRTLTKMNSKNDDRLIWEMVAREVYKCEQTAPLSAYLFLCELLGRSMSISQSRKMNSNDLQEVCKSFLGDALGNAFFNALNLSGPNATMMVEEIDGQSLVKTSDCVEVAASIPGEFGENFELRNVNFFTFDGIVEKVSDINRLLEDLVEKDEPAIILARGFGYEVVSTLLHNWRNKKLKVIPVSIAGDPMDQFLFMDIPDILGGNRIGIDDIWKERAKPVDHIEVEKGKIILNDPKISKASNRVSKKIIDDSPPNPASKEWAMSRARKISSRKITIFLGKEFGDLRGLVKDRIQSLVRFVLFARKFGVSIVNMSGNDIILPSLSITEAKKSSSSFAEIINNTKVIVSHDK